MTTARGTSCDDVAAAAQEPRVYLARDVMTAPVVAVSPADTIGTLLEALHRTGVRHLVVAEGGRCAGIVDDRRVVLEWAIGIGGAQRTALDLLPRGDRFVRPETPVAAVAEILVEDSRGAVPVVAHDGRVVGIVTSRDLLRCLIDSSDEGPQ